MTFTMTDNVTGTKLERVELHAHTKMSGFDSVIDTRELIETALKMGHKAVAITDHGCEGYLVNDDLTDDDGNLYLVIHTGSRNLGLSVATYYQDTAYKLLGGKNQSEVPYELAYLSGEEKGNYLHDMAIMQRYAALNRQIIKEVILDGMKLDEDDFFTTVHNYIDIENMILRKGSVSAGKGERFLIPLNMRDGALICTGLGNEDWNCSAPHGEGRLYSRGDAKQNFTVSAFKKEMEGIYTTTADADTLDECPMAYKDSQTIIDAIKETAEIERIIKPVYNFKSSEKRHQKNIGK